jgi:dGTPase
MGAGGIPRPVAPYAVDARRSLGRIVDEPPCPMRTPFQRDRDRIIHATAFRRLTYKTQVFLFHEGDHYRTRLTHSLEVAQIARTLARAMQLDEDLAEALALSHDLGHPPFGHAGERALARAMQVAGGFDHNAQSLAVVTRLERKYRNFDGLNLTLETLEGLVKHNGPVVAADHPLLVAGVAAAGLDRVLDLALHAPAEAQAAAIADDIAYNNHDIDDGLRAGLITLPDLADVPVADVHVRDVIARHPDLDPRRRIWEVNRRMITAMIADVIEASTARIAHYAPTSADDVRRAPEALIGFSPAMAEGVKGLKAFLFRSVYRHERVMHVMRGAEDVVTDLYGRYRKEPNSLPVGLAVAAGGGDDRQRMRQIGDFIAGMTDRFAIAEHRRLFDATPDLG